MNSSVERSEQRKTRRLTLHLPVLLDRRDGTLPVSGYTQNVSSKGFFCVCNEPFGPGERLFAQLSLPSLDRTTATGLRIHCEIEVVHTRLNAESGYGLGCEIRRFALKQATTSSDGADPNGTTFES